VLEVCLSRTPNPRTRGSSQRCSNCGVAMELTLSNRTFKCTNCGFVAHRDYNSALNHLDDTVGLTGISTPVETTASASKHSDLDVSGVVEAGTICDNRSSMSLEAHGFIRGRMSHERI
jgi:transposase